MRLQCFSFAAAAMLLSFAMPVEVFAQVSAQHCVTNGGDLRAVQAAFVAQCSSRPTDCDPFDGVWYCANFEMRENSPPSLSAAAPSQSLNPVAAINVPTNRNVPVCRSTASDSDNDGWGWENQQSCIVTSASSTAASSNANGAAPPPTAAATNGTSNGHPVCLTDNSDVGNTGYGYENNQTCVVVTGVTATRDQPLLNRRICTPWFEMSYGNYVLQNNTWNQNGVFSDNWSQCIELSGSVGNYTAKWDYNWLQRDEGNEYAVKSYPQVYYGRKTQYNYSGSVAQTGLPVRTRNMPQFWVEYDYTETGVVERNVALESFFHTSCEAEDHNKQYEMMVWVGVPSIRTPGSLATTVSLSGQEWDVYINPQLSWAYVAFVAKEPSNRGTLDWNAFVDWSRFRGPSFGVPAMANNTCMGAIEMGTETFWGTGTFTLNRFRVTRGN